jgi:HlyD family secretion protein
MRRRASAPHALLALLPLAGCAEEVRDVWQGYVEAELVYVASPLGGDLLELAVAEGQEVASGALLFRLDPNPEALQIEATREHLEQARARQADLEKGVRPSELAAIEARLESARAALERAERDFERRRELREAGHTDAVSDEELDRYRTERELRRAEVATLAAELDTARLGGREDAIEAARREVAALDAAVRELRWKIEEKQRAAPAGGLVQETLYDLGEYVPAGRPVVTLLPPRNLRVRFFVPQALLPAIALGDPIAVHADGLAEQAPATISFISPQAEYTPPVIYSRESREKLVFLVEAVPDESVVARLRPGQPVEVRLERGRP